jgi:hypothetical protein
MTACRRSDKPDPSVAMRLLIRQVRDAIPFDLPQAQVCTGLCNGCSVKLLDYLDTQLCNWEVRLAAGERPGLADLSRLGSTSRKVYRALAANGLVPMQSLSEVTPG